MKSFAMLVSAAALLTLALPLATAQTQVRHRSMDEDAIRRVLANYVDTWNTHDMVSWGKLFTDDVDYVNRAGGWWKNNKDNIDGHIAIHDRLIEQKQKMTYKSAVAAIEFLTPDVAIVHATWEWPGFVLPTGEEAEDFKGLITMVMVKRDDQWLIRALQNTVTQPVRSPSELQVTTRKQASAPASNVRNISVSIDRPPNRVYDFVSDPANLPKWATGLGGSIKNVDGKWIADAPIGQVEIEFAVRNSLGILDHDVILESGARLHNPMRVVPHGNGSVVVFTLLQHPEIPDEEFSQDAEWVAKDLGILKGLLEKWWPQQSLCGLDAAVA